MKQIQMSTQNIQESFDELIICKEKGEFAVLQGNDFWVNTTDDVPNDFFKMSSEEIYRYIVQAGSMRYDDLQTARNLIVNADAEIGHPETNIQILDCDGDIDKSFSKLIECKKSGVFGAFEVNEYLINTTDDIPADFLNMSYDDICSDLRKAGTHRQADLKAATLGCYGNTPDVNMGIVMNYEHEFGSIGRKK